MHFQITSGELRRKQYFIGVKRQIYPKYSSILTVQLFTQVLDIRTEAYPI